MRTMKGAAAPPKTKDEAPLDERINLAITAKTKARIKAAAVAFTAEERDPIAESEAIRRLLDAGLDAVAFRRAVAKQSDSMTAIVQEDTDCWVVRLEGAGVELDIHPSQDTEPNATAVAAEVRGLLDRALLWILAKHPDMLALLFAKIIRREIPPAAFAALEDHELVERTLKDFDATMAKKDGASR